MEARQVFLPRAGVSLSCMFWFVNCVSTLIFLAVRRHQTGQQSSICENPYARGLTASSVIRLDAENGDAQGMPMYGMRLVVTSLS